MSRIAYIISAYKDAPHLRRLVDALAGDADFYIHIDRNADIRPFKELLKDKTTFVPRHRVSWGGWGQVEYQKELLSAVLHSGIAYGRVVCLSGQDYPLWPNTEIHSYFDGHKETEFIVAMNLTRSADKQQIAKIIYYHFFRDLNIGSRWLRNKLIVASRHLMQLLPFRKRPFVKLGGKEADVFFGSDYWAITLPCARYVYEKLCTEKEMTRYFKTSFVPSELCVQTLVFNSPFAARALLYEGRYAGLHALTPLHYIVYGQSIKTMTPEDLPALKLSGKMFCRKVVSGKSDALIETIETERKAETS
ncbi:core-2/I-Branching enzyme [Bacteroides zoogleoformans]|uniref:Peptide O-xylosyltransferase n=1 Tax=Bacteroides zoogleoformans TaxID=28119 RepID=A0ABM6T932_9BACE|nr:beta-1,6-N-acetylglucosaminyltransferase [Bacteroides zoogleoformans]AVM52856.1 glycogen branching protein [Bacteroides zoogleoformans]TWJ18619.1 core-2/I-Branching enzyme [Bacteroides zoogleoformans]